MKKIYEDKIQSEIHKATDSSGFNSFYNKKGKPISMERFGILHSDKKYRIIKQEYSGNYWVSTVWIGLDHRFDFREGEPLIFETMAFGENEEQERYSTEKEAIAGHKKMVKKYAKKK